MFQSFEISEARQILDDEDWDSYRYTPDSLRRCAFYTLTKLARPKRGKDGGGGIADVLLGSSYVFRADPSRQNQVTSLDQLQQFPEWCGII